MSQRHFMFGTGNMCVLPVGGGPPIPIGAIQDISVDFAGDIKQLYGQSSFALDVSRGKVKIEGKAKTGLLDLNLFNSMFFGQSVQTGQTLAAFNEAGTVPASSTYTVTVANAATFDDDLGVYYRATGVRLTQVLAGSEALGAYSVNPATGVYTFASADASALLSFNYSYTTNSSGLTLTGNNTLMGAVPNFMVQLFNISKGKTNNLTLWSCVSSKLSMPFKQDDYEITELDFMAQDNGAGQVFEWSQTGG